jgi:F0F1-type ATP synthase delta subunit
MIQSISTNEYAQAFLLVIKNTKKEKRDGVIKRFLEYIEKQGDKRKLEEIIKIIQEHIALENGKHHMEIISARPLSEKQLSAITEAEKNNCDSYSFSINRNLIAGIQLIVDRRYILDCSLAKITQTIFPSLK